MPRCGRRTSRSPNVVEDDVPPGGEDDFDHARHRRHATADRASARPPRDRRPIARHRHRARRQGQRRPVLLPHRRRRPAGAGPGEPRHGAGRPPPASIPVIAPALVKPEVMEGTGFLGAHAAEVYRLADRRAVPGRHVARSRSPATTPTRSWTPSRCRAVRRFLLVLPARGRLARQGHPRHHPGALVRQGRDVLLHHRGERPRTSTASCWLGNGSSSTRWSWPTGSIDVAAGDLGTSAARKFDIEAWFPSLGYLPGADVDVELHDLPGPSAQHPNPGGQRQRFRWPRSTARCARSPAPSPACSTTISSPDGSVYVPEALRPWLGGRERLEPS